jgi:hypothetical protein
MRVDDELLWRAVAEGFIGLWRVLERDDLGIHDLAQIGHPVPQDRHHQIAINSVVYLGTSR